MWITMVMASSELACGEPCSHGRGVLLLCEREACRKWVQPPPDMAARVITVFLRITYGACAPARCAAFFSVDTLFLSLSKVPSAAARPDAFFPLSRMMLPFSGLPERLVSLLN